MSVGYQPKIVTDNLVLCLDAADAKSYSGSGTTWSDRIGNGTAVARGYVDGSFSYPVYNDKYFSFDGISQRFHLSHNVSNDELAYTPDNSLGSDTYTFEVWVRTEDTIGPIISKPWNGSGSYNYSLRDNYFRLQTSANTRDYSYESVADGQWHQICVSVDPTNVIITKDGGLYSVTHANTSSGSARDPNWNLGIVLMSVYPYGTTWAGNTSYSIQGDLASFRIYKKTLSPEEILQNYNAQKGRFGL